MIDVEAVVRQAVKNVDKRLDSAPRADLIEAAYQQAAEAREVLNRHMGRLQVRREEQQERG